MTEEKELSPFAKFFAGRLQKALGDRNQKELIKLMAQNGFEMAQQRLSHYMNGRNYPDPPILKELAKALEVSVDWLLGLTEQPLPAADLDEMAATAKGEAHINKVMRNMSKERQKQVIAFAEYLLSQERQNPGGIVPLISPLPLTERQQNLQSIKKMLDLIERNHGTQARRDMERSILEEFDNVDTEK